MSSGKNGLLPRPPRVAPKWWYPARHGRAALPRRVGGRRSPASARGRHRTAGSVPARHPPGPLDLERALQRSRTGVPSRDAGSPGLRREREAPGGPLRLRRGRLHRRRRRSLRWVGPRAGGGGRSGAGRHHRNHAGSSPPRAREQARVDRCGAERPRTQSSDASRGSAHPRRPRGEAVARSSRVSVDLPTLVARSGLSGRHRSDRPLLRISSTLPRRVAVPSPPCARRRMRVPSSR